MPRTPEDNDRRGTVTRLLQQCEADRPDKAHESLPLIYDELRTLAKARVALEATGHTI